MQPNHAKHARDMARGTSPARITVSVVFALLALAASLRPDAALDARERTVPKSRNETLLSFAPVVKAASPAVVNVYVRTRVRQVSPFFDDPFFRRFFGENFGAPPERMQNSLGSGVIVSADGLVVTNNHVIQGNVDAIVTVALADNREFEAKVILKDERTDLAVLRIIGGSGDFPYLSFGDSDALEVGDLVLAIGNPFGVGQTTTSGIVSALARTRLGITDYQFFIQTDAAINPGNSGGALIDLDGNLVGINTAIYSRTGGYQGIGFAIPSNMVRLVVDAALRGDRVQRPWFGAELQPMTADMAAAIGLDRATGALVAEVKDKSPAKQAGLRPGDVIISIDGRTVNDPQTFFYYFTTKGLGGEVEVEVLNGGRKRKTRIALIAPPETVPRKVRELSGPHPFSGAKVANLSPAVAEELSISEVEGVVVLETQGYSTARRVGLQPGDVILSVNGVEIASVDTLLAVTARPAPIWDLRILRKGRELRTVIRG